MSPRQLSKASQGIADKLSGSANAVVGADDDSHGLLSGVRLHLPAPSKLPPQGPIGEGTFARAPSVATGENHPRAPRPFPVQWSKGRASVRALPVQAGRISQW